jgi:hypothetical protein
MRIKGWIILTYFRRSRLSEQRHPGLVPGSGFILHLFVFMFQCANKPCFMFLTKQRVWKLFDQLQNILNLKAIMVVVERRRSPDPGTLLRWLADQGKQVLDDGFDGIQRSTLDSN